MSSSELNSGIIIPMIPRICCYIYKYLYSDVAMHSCIREIKSEFIDVECDKKTIRLKVINDSNDPVIGGLIELGQSRPANGC